MSPLEIDALPGAALDPAIARLRKKIEQALGWGVSGIGMSVEVAQSILDILERARDALLADPASTVSISKRDADYWLESRAAIITALDEAGFLLTSDARGFKVVKAPQAMTTRPAQAAAQVPMTDDTARLDWLEGNPRLAQIVIEGEAKDCYFYAVSGAPGLKLREIIDAARGIAAEQGKQEPQP